MRVLMVAHAFAPTVGGVQSYLWDLAGQLGARGHQVHLLVGGDPFEQATGPAGVTRRLELRPAALLDARRGLPAAEVDQGLVARLAGHVGAAVAAFGPDLLHVHDPQRFGPELALACLRAAGPLPLVASVHDHTGAPTFPEVLAHPWRAVLYTSEHVRAALPSGAPVSAVLPPGIDHGAFGPHGPKDPRLAMLARPVVFHPARLLPWKGARTGLEAFATLRASLAGSGPSHAGTTHRGVLGAGTLVLCASGDTTEDPAAIAAFRRQLEARAAELGVAGRLVFVELAREQMAAAYRAADLVWVPTVDSEPFGLAPLEAMACGVPVVVAASGGLRETVEPGVSGLTVPRADPVALAGAAAAVLVDGALRGRLVEGGLARAAGFDAGAHARAVARAYAAAAHGHGGLGDRVPGGLPA